MPGIEKHAAGYCTECRAIVYDHGAKRKIPDLKASCSCNKPLTIDFGAEARAQAAAKAPE